MLLPTALNLSGRNSSWSRPSKCHLQKEHYKDKGPMSIENFNLRTFVGKGLFKRWRVNLENEQFSEAGGNIPVIAVYFDFMVRAHDDYHSSATDYRNL